MATGDSGRRDHSDTLRKLGGGCGGGGAAFPRASEPAGQVPARPGRDPAPASHLPPEESRKTGAGEGTNEGAGRKKKKKSSIRYYLIRVTPLRESVIYWETLNQSSAAEQRVFCPMPQTEKREIHAVFLRFPVFAWEQNPSLSALADGIRASIKLF